MPAATSTSSFRRFSVGVLAFTLAVILWGAYVRASGSGAGCGSHWPTCNGEVIPRARSVATVIEFTHRATSGLAFLLVLAQTVWAFRAFPRGHGVRRAAAGGMMLMLTEALVGAGLVVFEMVAGNKSIARGAWTAAHLLNTNALLAALVLVLFRARTAGSAPPSGAGTRGRSEADGTGGAMRGVIIAGLIGLLVVSASGAITALGDTLFPSATLAEGIRQDFSATAHLFVRLRVWHPLLAAAVGLLLLVAASVLAARDEPAGVRSVATLVAIAVLCQVVLGVVNLLLLAPIPLQLMHLLFADFIWLGVVVLAALLRPRAPAS